MQGGARFFSAFSGKPVLGQVEGNTLRWRKNAFFRDALYQIEMTGEIVQSAGGAIVNCTFAPRFLAKLAVIGYPIFMVLGTLFSLYDLLNSKNVMEDLQSTFFLIFMGGLVAAINYGIYLFFAERDREFMLELLARTIDGRIVIERAPKPTGIITRSSRS